MGKTFSLLKTGCVHCVKSIPIPSYSGPHFPAFALNTKRYEVSHSVFTSNARKYGPEYL